MRNISIGAHENIALAEFECALPFIQTRAPSSNQRSGQRLIASNQDFTMKDIFGQVAKFNSRLWSAAISCTLR